MGAFNWINFEHDCPDCGQRVNIRAQTHIASSYNGDDTGRFHDRSYLLGDRMPWFKPTEKEYTSEWGGLENVGYALEACHSNCSKCSRDLYAVVVFENFVAVRVEKVGLEEEWPAKHPK